MDRRFLLKETSKEFVSEFDKFMRYPYLAVYSASTQQDHEIAALKNAHYLTEIEIPKEIDLSWSEDFGKWLEEK